MPRGVFDKALAAQAKAFGVRSPKYRQPVWHAWGAKALQKRSVLRLMERQEQILVGNPRDPTMRVALAVTHAAMAAVSTAVLGDPRCF